MTSACGPAGNCLSGALPSSGVGITILAINLLSLPLPQRYPPVAWSRRLRLSVKYCGLRAVTNLMPSSRDCQRRHNSLRRDPKWGHGGRRELSGARNKQPGMTNSLPPLRRPRHSSFSSASDNPVVVANPAFPALSNVMVSDSLVTVPVFNSTTGVAPGSPLTSWATCNSSCSPMEPPRQTPDCSAAISIPPSSTWQVAVPMLVALPFSATAPLPWPCA